MTARVPAWAIGMCRLAVGLVFVAAALPKISDPGSFATQVHHYRLVPFGLENLVAITLPWVELLVALALVLRIHARSAAVLAAALMTAFTAAVGLAVARQLDIECGCFGTADATHVGTAKLLENAALLGVACLAALRLRNGAE